MTGTAADEVVVCPECDIAAVTTRIVDHAHSALPDDAPQYRCTRAGCGARFDEPVRRPRRAEGGINGDTVAATLDEMTVAEFDEQARTEVDG